MSARIEKVRRLLDARGADAVLLTHPADIRWAVGFSGSNAVLAVTHEASHLVTDGRYIVQAAEEVVGAQVHTPGYDLIGHIESEKLLGFSGRVLVSAEHVTLADHGVLCEKLHQHEIVPEADLLVQDRAVKEEDEIERIRRAQSLTERVFNEILPMIAPGVSERDLAAEIVYGHLKGGADSMAFDPIVASGRRAALPHARASSKTIARGDVVLIDMGCYLDGYASDMTRTVVVGEAEPGVRAAYEAVLEAQLQAIDSLHGGVSTRDVDLAARKVFLEHGLEDYFTHSVGHGLGLDVHEWPRLSQHVDISVPAGTVVTVEPGVYLPERFGIRIEDIVVVRSDGPDVLTTVPKSLLEI